MHAACPLQLAILYPFCFFGQMACGAVFGIVPFLSHRRSGLTVGVVAAGGNVGAAVMQVGSCMHTSVFAAEAAHETPTWQPETHARICNILSCRQRVNYQNPKHWCSQQLATCLN